SVMHDPEGVRRLLARARSAGTAVSLDPSSAGFLADFGVERFLNVMDAADILLPNLDEGRMLAGLDDPIEVVRAPSARFGIVALTLGEDGCVVTAPGVDPTLVEAVPAALVDPTGAGDSFSAGFLAEWVASRDPVAAARAGAAVAARAVAVIGARPLSAPGS